MPRGSSLPASWSATPASEEAHHYRRLFEQAPDGHLLTDAAGRIVEANAVAGSLLGTSPGDLTGQPLVGFVSQEQKKSFKARLSRRTTRAGAAEEWEVRMRNREGRGFEAALAVTLLPEGKDAAASLLWSLRDITGRKRTEAKLKASERRHRSLYRQLLVQRDQLRFLSAELRPTLLDDLGIAPALGFLAESFSARTGIPVDVEGDLGQERLDPLVETALYRIIQEALANVGRHAEAGRVAIRLERRQRSLRFWVRDDGVGFDPQAVGPGRDGGLGLLGIRERLAAIGGRLEVVSSPGNGAQLKATLPLRRAS
jgi:PAS domain S-box-containing protein